MNEGERTNKLTEVAQRYTNQGYRLVAVEALYPGIFEDPVAQHEVEGQVDILFEDQYDEGSLSLVEVGVTESTSSDTLESMLERKSEKASENAEYFEGLGFDVDSEVMIYPEGDLQALRELYDDTTGVFTWGQAVDAVSEPGRLGNMKVDEITFQGLSAANTELYEIDEEYEEVVEMFGTGVFYP
jgi:hypothetical protein